jgi:pyruvate-formate lyase
MFNLADQMQAGLKANLPEAVATEMKTYLLNAENNLRALEKMGNEVLRQEVQIKEMTRELEVRGALDKQQEKVSEGEKKIAARALELDRKEAEIRAHISEAELIGIKDTMAMFLKVPEIRTSIQRTVGIPVAAGISTNGSYPAQPYVSMTPESETVTQTNV